MSDRGRKPKDRDFLRTGEGMFFCVTGYLHPPDRYTAYLKYSPTAQGKWEDESTAYRRELPYYHVRNVAKTVEYLEERYPEYVHDCPVRDFRFSMVPRERVAHYYAPQARMKEILRGAGDPLEEAVGELALKLAGVIGMDPAHLGITGSVLIGLHNPDFSDIDLTIYGLDNARNMREVLQMGGVPGVKRMGSDYVDRWSRGIADRFPLTTAEARYVASRRWNYGTYSGRYFSLHSIRSDDEIGEEYGEHVYRRRGSGRVRATVVDASEALFMPAIYGVEDVEPLEGTAQLAHVREIVSYEGLYRDVVDVGTVIEARGVLESVDGEPQRLVIGSMALAGQGYVKPAGAR